MIDKFSVARNREIAHASITILGLVGIGYSVIVGLPDNFRLCDELLLTGCLLCTFLIDSQTLSISPDTDYDYFTALSSP